MSVTPWRLSAPRAILDVGALRASADVTHPDQGLRNLRLDDRAIDGAMWRLGIAADEENIGQSAGQLSDAFVRGNDLVAKFRQTTVCPLRATIYWTAAAENIAAGDVELSLTTAIETDLLDSHPLLEVSTELSVSEVLLITNGVSSEPSVEHCRQGDAALEIAADQSAGGVALFRLPGGERSYAEMLHPGDFRQLVVDWPTGARPSARWRFFGQFLEKGVIRQARMRGLFLPRQDDITTAAEAYQAFADSEPCLTA